MKSCSGCLVDAAERPSLRWTQWRLSPADTSGVEVAGGPAPLSSYVVGGVWVCIFCGSRNPLDCSHCGLCGLSFRGGARRELEVASRLRGSRRLTRTASPIVEVAVAVGLFAAWRLGDIAAGSHTLGATGRGRDLWSLERSLRLPSERTVQRLVLPHLDVLHALDWYYALAHLGGMVLAAGWLYARHRTVYGRWRNAVVATTAACFALQLVPVAPPRSIDSLGLVDTAARLGESVYSRHGLANQVSSMPSVHFAWALLVAAVVVGAGSTRKRWLVVAHPCLTLLAIVVTANHYWLDAVVASLVTLVCLRLTRPVRAGPQSNPPTLLAVDQSPGTAAPNVLGSPVMAEGRVPQRDR